MINFHKKEKFNLKQAISSKRNILRIVFDAILLACVILIILRKSIFPEGSFLNIVLDDTENVKNRVDVKLFKTLFVVICCILAIELSSIVAFIGRFIKSNKSRTILLVVGNGCKYICGIMILFISLGIWGVNTAAIVTSASVLTLAISLGCQSMISDIVSGIFILFEGDVQVGDVVVIDGWRGTIEEIGVRRTKIVDTAGNVNIVNNSSITSIINNSTHNSFAFVEVGIEYGSDLQQVEKLIKDNLSTFKEHIPEILKEPVYLGVKSLGESSVVLKLKAEVKEENKFQVERDLNREIKLLFDANNINIPFPQVVVNYREKDK